MSRAFRMCPACIRRDEAVVAADCPVCAGAGVLELGAAALARYTPQVVSRAVEYSLEATARQAISTPHPDLTAARAALVDQVARLRAGKLLANRGEQQVPGTVGRRGVNARHSVASRLAGTSDVTPGQMSARVEFRPDDRPMAAGGLPGFSAGFYLSSLSRVVDPIDPMSTSTGAIIRRRHVTDQQARELSEAVPPPQLW